MRDGAADEPGARSRGRGGLGQPGFCGSARRGREEIAQYRDEAWGAQSPKIRPSSSQRQQGGPEKSKPAGFVADGQFQPKCLGSEFSRQIAVDFESNANLHKRGSCPGHSHLPFLSEERQTYSGPFQVARSAGRDMRQLPAAELACRPSPRSSRASEANVPECAIAHRQKRADRRLLDAPSEGGHQPAFQGGHQATRPCLPGYSARLTGDTLEIVLILGLNQQPARSGPSGWSLRGCSSSRVPPPVSIHSPPTALFLGLLSSRRLAPVPPLGSLEMAGVFPCFCPSPY
jgi:hypothetical protein